ncbi:MAG: NAD kinase [Bacteroidia bacterium]|jgi:NAD+ kinase
MKVAIYGRVFKKETSDFIQGMFDTLYQNDVEYITEELYLAQCVANHIKVKCTNTFSGKTEILQAGIDFFIVIGGDGTMLDSLVYMHGTAIPVIGINTGRLGFLTGENKTDFKKVVQQLLKGHYTLDARSTLKLESNVPLFEGITFALNDFVIHKKDSSSMMRIHTYINGEFLNSYWSDGLIVSTPTGSTGYSLSCGGPILYPGASSLVITPIAPHNLNVRPMVLSDDSILSFEIEDRSTSFLVSLDSRSETIDSKVQLAIRKADFGFNLVKFNNENYLTTLRTKLMWGIDNRNA